MPSFSTKCLNTALKYSRLKNKLDFSHPHRSNGLTIPCFIKISCSWSAQTVSGHSLVTLKRKKIRTRRHIVYFHGGAYAEEINMGHWFFFLRLLNKLPCRISVVDYPLAPENSFEETIKMSHAAVKILADEYPRDDFSLMGDSAGGGLAMVLCQILSEDSENHRLKNCFCFSPWTDLGMSNSAMPRRENSDHLLRIEPLKIAAAQYAKGFNLKDPRLSPLYGDFTHCPPMHIFYSDSEILGADCSALKEKLNYSAPHIRFYEFHNLPHVWPLFPVKEARQVLDCFYRFMKNDEKNSN